MARPRKKLARRTNRTAPTPRGPSDLAADASLEDQLTHEILVLDLRNKTRVVHDVVAIGERLEQLQRLLGFGRWLSWLSKHLPYSPRTAQRYIAVARWAADNPDDLELFAPLGLAKLQLLAALPPQQRARFRRQQRFQIPGTTTRKSLALMTHEQLDRVIRGIGGLTAAPPSIPPGKVLQRFRHRVAGLDALADELRANADALEPDDVADTVAALESVLDEVRALLP